MTLHFSTLFNEGTHVSVSTAFVFRYIVSLNAYPVLVETSSLFNSNLRRRKVPWNKIFYTSTFGLTWMVRQRLHMLVLSALLKDKSFYDSLSWYPEIDLVCVFQYCDISHIIFNLNKTGGGKNWIHDHDHWYICVFKMEFLWNSYLNSHKLNKAQSYVVFAVVCCQHSQKILFSYGTIHF